MRYATKWPVILSWMLIAVGLGQPVWAGTDDGANRLAEIVVSADPINTVETVGSVYRITAQQIREQGANTLDEALQLIPGISVREGGEGTPRIDIRGFRTRHVQLFLNGVPIRETYDDQFDPTTIPVEYIAEIKVTTGGASVLYGQGGNGGAIDIITKKGQKGVQGSVTAEVGEGNRYIGRATVGGANDNVNAFAAASYYDRDYFKTADKYETPDGLTDERLNSDRRRVNFFGNLGYHLSEKTQLGITASHTNGDNGKPPVVDYSSSDPFAPNKLKYERTDDLDNSLFQAVMATDPDGPTEFRIWGYYNQLRQEDNAYDAPVTNDPDNWTQVARGASHEVSHTHIMGVSSQIVYRLGTTGTATLGLNAEQDSYESDGFSIKNNGSREETSLDHDTEFYSAALQYEHHFSDRLGGVVGYSQQFMNKDEGDDDSDFSYMVGAYYNLTDSTLLRLNHARKVRFPSIRQLYSGDPASPDLNAETTWHYEAGIEQTLPAASSLQVTGFYTQAEDFIEKNSDDVYQNYQKLFFRGFEVSLTTHAVEHAMLRVSYSFLDTEDKSDNATRDELQYRPAHTIIVEGRYTFGFGLDCFASLRHVADQYFYDRNDILKKELGDYTVVNVKVSQSIGTSGVDIYVGAENLLDENYAESYELPQAGRTLYAGMHYRY